MDITFTHLGFEMISEVRVQQLWWKLCELKRLGRAAEELGLREKIKKQQFSVFTISFTLQTLNMGLQGMELQKIDRIQNTPSNIVDILS